jgi:HK97 family phage portal protein
VKNPLELIKSVFTKTLIDPYPEYVVAQDPSQFWQKALDRNPNGQGACAASESGFEAYAQSVAQLPVRHMKHVDQEYVPLDSDAVKLLKNPNGYQTQSEFFSYMVRRLLSQGNAYAVATRDRDYNVNGFHPVMANHCEPYVDPETRSIFYSVSNNDLAPFEVGSYMIPARDVLHMKLYTPYHPLKGVSPISYAANSMAANRALSAHAAAFFNNMARPSFVLTTDMSLTSDQLKQLRAAWEDQSQHMNSGGVPILSSGLKADQLGISTQDAQLVQAFNMTVEDIGRALRIPLPLMGIQSTYSDAESLIGFWLSSGLGFVVNHVEQSLAKFLGLPYDETIEFNTDALLRADYITRVDGATKGIIGGLFSPDEARAKFNLPKVPFGDEPRVQQQVVPLSQVGKTPEPAPAPVAPPPAPEKELNADSDISRALVVDMLTRKKLQ